MAEHKVLIMGVDDDDPLDYERAEMADLDVEFVKANPDSEGEAIELVRDADALMMRSTPYQGEQVHSRRRKGAGACRLLARLQPDRH